MKKLSASRKRSIESLEDGQAIWFTEESEWPLSAIVKCPQIEILNKYAKYDTVLAKVCQDMHITLEQALAPLPKLATVQQVRYHFIRASKEKKVQMYHFDSLEDKQVQKAISNEYGVMAVVVLASKQTKGTIEELYNVMDEFLK